MSINISGLFARKTYGNLSGPYQESGDANMSMNQLYNLSQMYCANDRPTGQLGLRSVVRAHDHASETAVSLSDTVDMLDSHEANSPFYSSCR